MTFPRPLDRTLWPAVILLALVLALFERFPLDLQLQDRLFHHSTGKWLIDAQQPVFRHIFYNAPKRLLLGFGVLLAVCCFAPRKFRSRFMPTETSRREWLVVLATLITAPLLISASKSFTHVFCPFELVRYGGSQAYKPICERYTPFDRPSKFGRGFPAGHASGGFALLSLAGVGATRRSRLAGLAIGLTAGSLMGAYQILKGAHFLSHTLVTAIVCWIIFLIWRRLILSQPVIEGPPL